MLPQALPRLSPRLAEAEGAVERRGRKGGVELQQEVVRTGRFARVTKNRAYFASPRKRCVYFDVMLSCGHVVRLHYCLLLVLGAFRLFCFGYFVLGWA